MSSPRSRRLAPSCSRFSVNVICQSVRDLIPQLRGARRVMTAAMGLGRVEHSLRLHVYTAL